MGPGSLSEPDYDERSTQIHRQRVAEGGSGPTISPSDERTPTVLMVTEGAYPHYLGGVGIWCDRMIRDLPHVPFRIFSIVGSPNLAVKYELPANVLSVRQVAIWGVREIAEGELKVGFGELRRRRSATTNLAVSHGLIPHLERFLLELFQERADTASFAGAIHQIHRFFLRFDFDTAVRSRAVWDIFEATARAQFPRAAAQCGWRDSGFALGDITDGLTFLSRWLITLSRELPTADVTHAVSAGLPCLPAIAAKLEFRRPFLLTEHGIYLRERYLVEAEGARSRFLKLFSLRFAKAVTDTSYAVADQVSPGSNYNQRWELRRGATPERLRTIYNGVDPSTFGPRPENQREEGGPSGKLVVVWVGRITPIKDVHTLLRAARVVCSARPEVEFRLFGTAPAGDEAYYQSCLALAKELGLEQVVKFGGYAASAEDAFNQGDIVVLSSISEGFPYSVIEAMLCARPIVATAVGGVPEAIVGCGISVPPGDPRAMGAAILELGDSSRRRIELGLAGRERATDLFNLRQCANAYDYSYRRLAFDAETLDVAPTGPSSAALVIRLIIRPTDSGRRCFDDGNVSTRTDEAAKP